MAFDRMWLVHKHTGKRILIGKCPDGYHWYARSECVPVEGGKPVDIEDAIDGLLDHARAESDGLEQFKSFAIEFESD